MNSRSYGATVLLACGHESSGGAALSTLNTPAAVVAAGRQLSEAVTAALRRSDDPVCVVPMTLGRDPGLVAESARALRWAAESGEHRVVLSEPFGTTDHLIGWLRSAVLRFERTTERGLLIAAPTGGPFDDAELFRVARLVRQYGHFPLVEVALAGGDPDVAEGVQRLTRLGAPRIGLISAGFGDVGVGVLDTATTPVDDAGPLLGSAMIAQVVRARVVAALDGRERGDDGIAAGLDAEHGHGYAHSHSHSHGSESHSHPDGEHDHHHHGHHHHHHHHHH